MKNTPGNKLRQAVADNHPLQVVGAVTAYCAILAQKSGHKALYLSGGGVAGVETRLRCTIDIRYQAGGFLPQQA